MDGRGAAWLGVHCASSKSERWPPADFEIRQWIGTGSLTLCPQEFRRKKKTFISFSRSTGRWWISSLYATEDGSLRGIQNKLPTASPSSNKCVDLLSTRSWAGVEIFPRVLPAVHRYVPASRCLTCLMDNPPLGSSSIELQRNVCQLLFLVSENNFWLRTYRFFGDRPGHVMAGLDWLAASQTRRADDPSCTSTSSGVTTNFGFTAHTHKILSEGNKSTLSGIDECCYLSWNCWRSSVSCGRNGISLHRPDSSPCIRTSPYHYRTHSQSLAYRLVKLGILDRHLGWFRY